MGNRSMQLLVFGGLLMIFCTAAYPQELAYDSIFDKDVKFEGMYFSNQEPDTIPIPFGQGLIDPEIHHIHSAPAFSPSLDEMFFSVYLNYGDHQRIFYSQKVNGVWNRPALAAFSGDYSDGGPVFSPEGNTLFFYSKRPVNLGDSTNQTRIWYVVKSQNKWEDPKLMFINDSVGLSFYPDHLTSDGTLYFSVKAGKRDYDLYKGMLVNSQVQNIQKLEAPFSLNNKIENGVTIDPENSILIFQALDRDGDGKLKLMMSRRENDSSWTAPRPLSPLINIEHTRFASFTPDGKYFIYTSYKSGVEEMYWLKSSFLIEK